MESQIQIFEHEQFGKIRVIVINGEPWFVAADTCHVLELGNPSQALKRLDEDEKQIILIPAQGIISKNTRGGEQKMLIVNEPGFYRLVFASRKKEARDFQRWVYHEVLPAIRKTGSYSSSSAPVKKTRRQISALVCVYVLLLSNGLIKIGHTSNISRRIAEIKRQTKSTIKAVYHTDLFSREIACRIEYVCQENFSSFRTEGEFFNVDFVKVCEYIEPFIKAEVERSIVLLKITSLKNEIPEEKTVERALLMEAAIFEQPVD